MPTNKEIVEALREGADSAISCQINFKLFHKLKSLAKQVEAMEVDSDLLTIAYMGGHADGKKACLSEMECHRCKNCKEWAGMPNWVFEEKCSCKKGVPYQGPDFGCIHWEKMEDSNA